MKIAGQQEIMKSNFLYSLPLDVAGVLVLFLQWFFDSGQLKNASGLREYMYTIN
jgi:hypothetical protein